MSRRVGFGLAAALLATAGCERTPPPAPVILISADTLRADRLNAYGYARRVLSPTLDAMAEEGVLFEQHITSSPWTTPAHMSMLTSLSPSAHGVTAPVAELEAALRSGEAYPRLGSEATTLAEVLRGKGYATAAFTGGGTMDPMFGFDRGHDRYEVNLPKMSARGLDEILAWIDGLPQGRPFFLFLHTFEVHAPYLEADFVGEVLEPEHARRVQTAVRRLRNSYDEKGDFALPALLERHEAALPEVYDALYDGGVRSMDHWVSRLFEELRERGLYQRSAIAFTSDHGEELGQRGGRVYNLHGHNLYDEMVRVPLILKLPGAAAAGTRVAATTRTVDLAPTLLDVAAAGERPASWEGRSLRPAWEGGALEHDAATVEAVSGYEEKKALRSVTHKLVVTIPPEVVEARGRHALPASFAEVELYDLRRDPGETENLSRDPSERVERLQSLMLERLHAELAEPMSVGATSPDPELTERLRALGYIE